MLLCPACMDELRITERQGVEIDYCPKCRGVWLDRGELDKIIDRSTAAAPMRHGYEEEYHSRGGHRQRKRKSFLEELFDFD
jgi:Zn-finger nucleic acid-binding protein